MKLEIKMLFEEDTQEEAEKSARLFFLMLAADPKFFAQLRKNGKAGVLLKGALSPGDSPRSAEANAVVKVEV